MKNIDRLAQYITKNGSSDLMIHSIAGTTNWLICQKIEADKWMLTLGNPMGNTTYNLGTVNNKQHLELWKELSTMEIEQKKSNILMSQEFKNAIKAFMRKNENQYKKFTKRQK